MYKKIEETKVLPHTAAVSPQVLQDNFQKYIDEGYDIIFTGIGAKMSTTNQNAHIAVSMMENVEDRIYILDSANLSSGTGLLAAGKNGAEKGLKAEPKAEQYIGSDGKNYDKDMQIAIVNPSTNATEKASIDRPIPKKII